MKRKRIISGFVTAQILGWIVILALNIFLPLKVDVEYSTIIESEDGEVLHAFLTNDDKWRMYTRLEEITPELKEAIRYKEDKYFFFHHGLNPVAIARAFVNNILSGKRTSGASTITMQVARLLEPKNRTYFNKLTEIFRAFQLELYYSKEEIFQMYLNLVPYGGNIEGVKSASVLFFDKAPNHLNLAQITTLSIIPNRPTSLALGKKNERIIVERNKWLKRFRKEELFENEVIQDALLEPLDVYRKAAPQSIPHLAIRLKQKFNNKRIIRTGINKEVQRKTESIVKNYVNSIYHQNIKNACVLVINNQTMEVEVYVGSADFYNKDDAGQVDGIQAIRSPGSTLKPLLYAAAFDQGIITPKRIIADVPVDISGYAPENYDQKFHGNITIEEALSKSLNIPAVKILDQLTIPTFLKYLNKAQFDKIIDMQNEIGLSLVLGGCGVTLEQLTTLYASFQNNGYFQQIKWSSNENDEKKDSLISEEAAYFLKTILQQENRPDLPVSWRSSINIPQIAWKTGTSYGRRDAWSIGFNRNYTVGVWVGNFSAEGVPSLSGAAVATPLLFNIFNSIDYGADKEHLETPEGLDLRYVCSETGLIPNSFCENQVIDYFIPLISNTSVCRHKKKHWVDVKEKVAYCTSCLPAEGYKEKWYPNLEAALVNYYELNQINFVKVPTHNPDCERVFGGKDPKISSPVNGLEYLISDKDSQEILLKSQVTNDVNKVFWYINDVYFAESLPDSQLFFKPPEGNVKISCSDDKGRNANVRIKVKYVSF